MGGGPGKECQVTSERVKRLQALGVSVCCFVMFPFLRLFSENSLYVKCNTNLTCLILGVLTNSYPCTPNADQDVERCGQRRAAVLPVGIPGEGCLGC